MQDSDLLDAARRESYCPVSRKVNSAHGAFLALTGSGRKLSTSDQAEALIDHLGARGRGR